MKDQPNNQENVTYKEEQSLSLAAVPVLFHDKVETLLFEAYPTEQSAVRHSENCPG